MKQNNNDIFAEVNENIDDADDFDEAEAEIENAKKILRAIEAILDDNEDIIAVYEKACLKVTSKNDNEDNPLSETQWFTEVGKKIVNHYTTKATASGAISGVPAVIPGLGSLVGFLGASIADVVLTLKFEVEMTLCLCHLAGFNIEKERHRQLAFTLASVTSYEIRKTKNTIKDSTSLAASAFWDYSIRQLSKYLFIMISKRALLASMKKTLLIVPVVGIAIGAGMNRILTKKTGLYVLDTLWDRRMVDTDEDVIDAKYEEIKEDNNE